MIYAITIFLSAFLLFMVQLVMGKMILPWFGGTPAVWTACMLFFQVLLLAGYGYAHWTDCRFAPKRQGVLHAVLVAGSLILLLSLYGVWGSPILPSDSWKPVAGGVPVLQILTVLLVSVGWPFFVLSTTSPLLQRWYSLAAEGDKPYRLYAVSNVGSMLGLLSYPFLVEPVWRLETQAIIWFGLYVVYGAAVILCALGLARWDEKAPVVEQATERGAGSVWGRVWAWLLLSACTSATLLAVTNNLCQDIAVVPFLWVLPLVLYLLSFVICFDRPGWYRTNWFVPVCMVASVAVMVSNSMGARLAVTVHVISSSLFLFLFCMTCHGELVKLRPSARHLTLFYLAVALGGAVGGVFVAVVAPLLFDGYWEFNAALLAGWGLLGVLFALDKNSFFYRGQPAQLFVLMVLVGAGFLSWLFRQAPFRSSVLFGQDPGLWSIVVGTVLAAAVAWLTRGTVVARWKLWPRGCLVVVILIVGWFTFFGVPVREGELLAASRNFYGVLRVHEVTEEEGVPAYRRLTHGQINHGIQFLDPKLRREPTSYYGPSSGIQMAVRNHARRRGTSRPMKVGVLGLGVGTVAAFLEQGDAARFYEINPAVIDYAWGEGAFFTYLDDCPGEVEVVLGDARLSLERELSSSGTERFDLLVMDAFSSDSVPVHLLTVEAFELYLRHLRDEESVIAVNISNRFLDFRDLIASVASHFGLRLVLVSSPWGDLPYPAPSLWALLTRDVGFLQQPEILKELARAEKEGGSGRHLLWTDHFSNQFELLR